MAAARAASLAQRAQLRSSPLLALPSRPSSAITPAMTRYLSTAPRGFSIASSSRPQLALRSTPFATTVAHRNLSLWPFSKSAPKQDASTFASELEHKKDSAVETVGELKQSAEHTFSDASATVSENAQAAQDAVSDAASSLSAKASELAHEAQEKLGEVDAATATTLSENLGGAMGIRAGELSELGLNHWVTPPGWLTNVLEIVGETTGLPWWATIALTTVTLRTLILPVNVAGQKNAIRLGNVQPQMKRMMDDVKHYKAAGDQMQMQKSILATRKLLSDNNANPLGSLVPLAVQLPLMFSFYLALSRLAASGSETFAHGGPFWSMDLTQPDPTWVLPVVSTVATAMVAELGFKFGTTAQSGDPGQANMIKNIFRAIVPVIGYFSTTFPSGVLVYWATTNLYSVAQLLVLQIPVVRRLAKFPKRIVHPKNPYAEEKTGFMAKIRAAREQLSDSNQATPKPVVSAATGAQASRSDALKEILDDKAAYEAKTPQVVAAEKEATRNRERVLKARQRRARK